MDGERGGGTAVHIVNNDDNDVETYFITVLVGVIPPLPMSTVDVEQAASVPLPLSPPAGGSATISFSLPDSEHVREDAVNEEHTETHDEENLEEIPINGEEAKEDVEPPVAEQPAKESAEDEREQPASSPASTAHTESERVESTVASQDSRPSTSTIPPTPPSKADVLPEVRSPPPRHDSLTPASAASPRGPVRPSAEHADPRRANGHQAPSRPASAASHRRSLTISKGRTVSAVLISSALETIAASREAKRSQQLRESVQRALEMVKRGEGGDRPREIFEPLRLACETRNEKLMIASLDCISKLISYSFFVEASDGPSQGLPSPPPSPGPGARPSTSSATHPPGGTLVDLVVHTITSCHSESTPETVSLQIVKALLALVLSPTVLVHQSSLLKAVRTVYNVFLLSVDPINQTVAQGGLTQMVNHVFARCKLESSSLSRSTSSATLASRAESTKRRSLAPNSPMRFATPLSPPASDNRSMSEVAEPAPNHVNENIARAESADTPLSETVELPTNGHAEDEGVSTPSRQSYHKQ